jgi:hypothetical protein
MRVGGGIYTKAADVGADLVGKIEKDIPEDDPRNAATIADNVGDNVGDCAGMAADIFESYEVTIVAAMILGWASFGHVGVLFPILVRAIGVFASIISTYLVKAGDKGNVGEAMKSINFGFIVGSAISVVGFLLLGFIYLRFDATNMPDQAKLEGIMALPGWANWGARRTPASSVSSCAWCSTRSPSTSRAPNSRRFAAWFATARPAMPRTSSKVSRSGIRRPCGRPSLCVRRSMPLSQSTPARTRFLSPMVWRCAASAC